jgi:hypothetical protein
MNYSKYSKYKKNEQSVLLFGNDSRISSNQSFVMPSNTGLTEANKSTHNKTISQIDSKKDFSKINIEGRKMMNPFINPIKTHKRRIGSSYPLWKCEDTNLRNVLPQLEYKIPFCIDAKWDTDKCTIQKSRIFAPKVKAYDLKIKKNGFNFRMHKSTNGRHRDHGKWSVKKR